MSHFELKGKTYELRELLMDDLEEALRIENNSHANPWSKQNFISSIASSHHTFAVVYNDTLAAYGITSTAADEAELLNITVAKTFRRIGLATLLLDLICKTFDDKIQTLFLEVRESNHGAIELYESLDFNTVGHRPHYYPATKTTQPEHAIIMAKTINFF